MNLYISNLSYNISDEDLRQLFADYGEITSAKVIMDRETGRSRGFGFVELSDDELAKKAIEELNQASYDGKVINITEADLERIEATEVVVSITTEVAATVPTQAVAMALTDDVGSIPAETTFYLIFSH